MRQWRVEWLVRVEVQADSYEHAIEATRGEVITPNGKVLGFSVVEVSADERPDQP